MQSETLFSLIGKIRVQRIRLSSQPNTTVTGPWTPEEEIKFEDVKSRLFSLSNSMVPTLDSSTLTSQPNLASKFEESTKKCTNSLEESNKGWKTRKQWKPERTTSTKRFLNAI